LTIGIVTALKIVSDIAASSPVNELWVTSVALYTNLRCLQY